jgi:hypothetical protein
MTAALTESPPFFRPILEPVDPDRSDRELALDELGARIVGLSGQLAAATCRWLLLVADFDRRDGCASFGLASTARWLSHHCGLAHRTAVEHVRVARALDLFPSLADEMRAGRLSYSQVRAISRIAHDGESRLVDELIEVAQHGSAGQLEVIVRGLRTVEDNETPDGSPPEEYVRQSWSSDSQWRCNARLAPERGAVVRSAIDAIAQSENLSQADALVRMAEIALAALHDSDNPPRGLRGEEHAAVIIHLDAAALPDQPPPAAEPDADRAEPRSAERGRPFARVAKGPGLPKRVVERLLCAGRIRTAARDRQGNVLDVGRSHRVVTDRQFRALLIRDGGHCTHPGCESAAGLEAHHVRHWLYGGRTDLDNLVLLCRRHHHAHHDGEFTIIRRGGGFEFLRADGRVLERRVDPSRLATDESWSDIRHAGVRADAPTTQWTGERLDRHYAVAVLAHRRVHAP